MVETSKFTIKDVEKLTQIKAHTIRIWEQRYDFLKPQRSDTNIRYYNNEELKKVINVALLNKYGFKISHINKMTEEDIALKILNLNNATAQQERIVNELVQKMIDVDIEKFEEILDSYILSRGIEKTILNIIFPYMEKIGILWLTNHINPAQEHLVTNVIRQKIIVGIESLKEKIESKNSILIFLPEAEYHEIGILFMYYMIKSRRINTIYLGSNVPLNDVEYLVKLKNPTYIYTHLTTGGNNFNFDKFINAVNKKFVNNKVIISGQLTQTVERKVPASIVLKKSFSEMMQFVNELD